MKIKSVIFDLDGTLLDTIEDIADSNNKMLRNYGFPEHEIEKYIRWIGNGARKLVIASLPPNANVSEDRLWDYIHDYSKIYAQNIAVKTKLYEGISDVLDYLAANKIPISINTNKPHDLTKIICEKYLQSWSFKYIYGHNGNFLKKPNPQAALAIAKGLDIKPENILFIGDSAVDIKTAKKAGMPCLGVRWGYGNQKLMEELGCENMINSPSQIIKFIESHL